MMTTAGVLEHAVALHQRGDLAGAEALYQELSARTPTDPHPIHYLGLVAFQRGEFALAAERISRAIALAPEVPEFQVNLGNVLRRSGNPAAAEAAYRRATELRPNYFEAIFNLGLLEESRGDLGAALATLQQVNRLRPEDVKVWTSLARVLQGAGHGKEALNCSERSLALPGVDAEALLAHGLLLMRVGMWQQAVRHFRKVLRHHPRAAGLWNGFGQALSGMGEYGEAESALQQAVTLQPANPPMLANLAGVQQARGRVDEALQTYHRALDLAPDAADIRSSLLFAMLLSDAYSPADVAAAHQDFAALGRNLAAEALPPVRGGARTPLRVGYLSGDLRRHPVGYFLAGILAHHDPSAVEVLCYHNALIEDELTAALRQHAAAWVPCAHLSDAALAARIRADGVDVLVELSGHTAGNRLLMLARRAAPVQVSYLGYAHSTCLPWIDYRLTDALADPPDAPALPGQEALYRLPGSYYCYTPPAGAPDVNDLPARRNGYLTFGAALQLGKLTPATRQLWADVLQAVPGAKLLLRAKGLADRATREAIADEFGRCGVARNRLLLEGWRNHSEHLRGYQRVDIGLDTFPFNLATNTCEALWMGVPTLSLAGDRHSARMGASLLGAVGLPEFVAATPTDLVARARQLAGDLPGLADLRRGLRERVRTSPLVDATAAARALEAAYGQMMQAIAGRGGS